MTSIKEWSNYVKIFAIFIMLGGGAVLGLSFYKLRQPLHIIAGGIFIAVGFIGLLAGYYKKLRLARVYLGSLMIAGLICTGLMAASVIYVSQDVIDYCDKYNLDPQECRNVRTFSWVYALVGLIITITSCCCCIFCAYSYLHVVQVDVQYHPYDVTNAGYNHTYPPYYEEPRYGGSLTSINTKVTDTSTAVLFDDP